MIVRGDACQYGFPSFLHQFEYRPAWRSCLAPEDFKSGVQVGRTDQLGCEPGVATSGESLSWCLTRERCAGIVLSMGKPTRFSKTFTVDRSILKYLQRTRSTRSRSERVNELLRRGIIEERYEALEREAEEFFADTTKAERTESRAFSKASLKTFTRDEG